MWDYLQKKEKKEKIPENFFETFLNGCWKIKIQIQYSNPFFLGSRGFGGAGLGKGYGPEGVPHFSGAGLGKGYGLDGVSQIGGAGLGRSYGPGGVSQFGGAGLFAGVPRSSSGKSIH